MKKNEKAPRRPGLGDRLRRSRWSILALLLAALLFVGLRLWLREPAAEAPAAGDFVEYERARVEQLLTDSSQQDPTADGGWRGEQMLTAQILTGRYAGETLLCYNYIGPLYGVPVSEGDEVVLTVSTYAGGDHRATVFEFNRIPALLILLGLFVLVTVLVGGRTGLRSLVGLGVTVLVLFGVLLPLLMRGAPTIPTTFLCCAYVAAVAFLLLGGLQRKTICAALGTIAGTALAMAFGLMAQSLCRVSGLRISDVEPLLQLRQTGTPIGLRGLLVAGVIVSSLGAVMDVAMSIASALDEVHAANPALGFRALLRSGMNIGRDMVGTMTNTLILAFLGSGFTLILYLYTLGLSRYQLFSSAYVAIEVISSLSSSIGMILAIPITAVISSGLVSRGSKEDKA